jgi:DNA-binding transcriptional ArsR family regulator
MRTSEDPALLDRMFFALSDASRRAMLDRLSKAPASVSDLAQPLQMALPSAVKHLTVLEQGGLVLSEKTESPPTRLLPWKPGSQNARRCSTPSSTGWTLT